MSDLETKFKEAHEKASAEINEHLEKASVELLAAIKVSEKYGIPFSTNVSFLPNTYTPESFSKMWKKLDKDSLNNLFEEIDLYVDAYCLDYGGWEHSDVC